jgi:hypothetical protein
MANPRMTLLDLLSKAEQGADPDFLRDGLKLLAQELMDAEVTQLVGAGLQHRVHEQALRALTGRGGKGSARTAERIGCQRIRATGFTPPHATRPAGVVQPDLPQPNQRTTIALGGTCHYRRRRESRSANSPDTRRTALQRAFKPRVRGSNPRAGTSISNTNGGQEDQQRRWPKVDGVKTVCGRWAGSSQRSKRQRVAP